MKYFILEEEQKDPLPKIGYWFGTLGPESNTTRFFTTPVWVMLDAEIHSTTLYADVLSYPCILLSEKAAKVFDMYLDQQIFKRVVLMSKKSQTSLVYFLAKLPRCSFLGEESEYDKIKSHVIRGILDQEKLEEVPIFLLGEVTKPTLIIREDAAESLLRRGIKGIKLQEIELRRGGADDNKRRSDHN